MANATDNLRAPLCVCRWRIFEAQLGVVEVQNVSILVSVGSNDGGCREILVVAEGSRGDKESWSNFLRYLKERCLKGVRPVISDKCPGLYEILDGLFPEAK